MIAKSGDVFCVYNNLLKKFTACQITKIEEKNDKALAVLLSLDWSGDEPLKVEELSTLRALYMDFMYWEKDLHMMNVSPEPPLNYIFVGNIKPLSDESTNTYSFSWGNGYDVYRQLKWQEIPQKLRDEFKKAVKSKEKVDFAGEKWGASISRLIDENSDFENALELNVFKCLSTLICKKWHNGLYEYLQDCPFLNDLTLENHGQSKLDFSKSHLIKLTIDMTGVKELYLNDDLEQLILLGEVDESCRVKARDDGENLLLPTGGKLPKIKGLKNLGKLHCSAISEIDLSDIFEAYPNLRELRLWGKPGIISNFALIRDFKNIEGFTTNDIFGFCADDIPEPEIMPKLSWFWMSSLPEDAAKKAKKLYKDKEKQGLNLWIQKPRKAEWLSQNLDNPFRSWDGQENIPLSAAKKAADLYKKTRAKIIKLEQSTMDEAKQIAETLVKEYTEGFNKLDKGKYFIETIERDEIYTALDEILNLIPTDLDIDKNKLLELFDNIRDF